MFMDGGGVWFNEFRSGYGVCQNYNNGWEERLPVKYASGAIIIIVALYSHADAGHKECQIILKIFLWPPVRRFSASRPLPPSS